MTTAAAAQVPMVEITGQTRGIGVLELLGATGRVELPLAGVEISAKLSSFVAEVTVRQTFKNPHTEHLEAEYVFPLAGGCAVGRFELHVAGRIVIGKVEERGEARRQYAEAIRQGKRAAILEQERSNVFTVKVGNLPPGEDATVLLTYSERLVFFDDGAAELRLPLVVAPRYIAGTPIEQSLRGEAGSGEEKDTDKVPDASRLTPPRLAEGFDPRTGLKIEVELIGTSFDELCSSQHATRTSMSGGKIGVRLARAERLDRDFVLRWRLGGPEITSGLQTFEASSGECYGMLTLVPPRREGFLGLPREVVFVVDRSGSMGGVKMASAARACALLLRTLGPRDRFAVQAFDDRYEWLREGRRRWFKADEAGIEKGETYLRGIDARGGTELDGAMREAIAAFTGAAGNEAEPVGEGLPIIVLLTDGQVGDESSVLKRLQTKLGGVRVFTVGVDTAVNDGFLRKLAAVGGGTATMVEPGSALDDALRSVGREIGAPLVTDLELHDDGSGLDTESLAPARLPDLFEGRAATVFVKLKKSGPLEISGVFVDGEKFRQRVNAQELELPALAQLWARFRVADLEDRYRLKSAGMPMVKADTAEGLKSEIVRLACAHTLLTRFTAFVALDTEVVNKGGEQRRIVQPVELPADWEGPVLSIGAIGMAAMPPPAAGVSIDALGFDDSSYDLATLSAPSSYAETGATASEQVEIEFWKAIKDGNDPDDFELYVEKFPNGIYASLAKRKLAKLEGAVPQDAGAQAEAAAEHERKAAQEAARRDAEAKQQLDDEVTAVRNLLEALARALSRLHSELLAGRVPAPGALETARKELLSALATFSGASHLPQLQKFLRAGVAELVAALRAKMGAAALLPMVEKHLEHFAAVSAEAKTAFEGGAGRPAWEASI